MRTAAALMVAMGLAIALPLPVTPEAQGQSQAQSEAMAKRETISRMLKVVPSLNLENQRLEDAINFIQELTGADLEVMWIDDRNPDGLDPETPITLRVSKVTALTLLEKILDKAKTDTLGGGNSWQMSDTGSLQIGPKERLNAYRRIEMYDINDLLLEVPDYDNAPEFDLSQVLQQGQGGGGGGGQSPFQDSDEEDTERVPRSERAVEIQELITELVEFEQWVDNGGDAATIRYWQGTFIVNAPDYVHRQIAGYPWWPARRSAAAPARQGRYVTLNGTFEHAEIDGFAEKPVTGTVGGTPPGGGG